MDDTSSNGSAVTPQDWIYAFIYLRNTMANKKRPTSSRKQELKETASLATPRRSARLNRTVQGKELGTAPAIPPSPSSPKPTKSSLKPPRKAKATSKRTAPKKTRAEHLEKANSHVTKKVRFEEEAATSGPRQATAIADSPTARRVQAQASIDPPPARTKPNRPFYSYVRAWDGQLVPIDKRLARESDHSGPLPALDPDHWPQVAKYRWLTFLSLVAPYDADTEIQPSPDERTLKAMAPSREWWLAQPVSLLRYWVDVMGVFSYLDGLELELGGFVQGNILKEPQTIEEFVDGMERMRVKLMMYQLPGGDGSEGAWEVADNCRPYVFLPRELHGKFMEALISDLEGHGFAVVPI